MVTGSVASSAYGTPRSTADLDIVIAATKSQLTTFMRAFPADCYYADEQQAMRALAKHSQFNIIDSRPDGSWTSSSLRTPTTAVQPYRGAGGSKLRESAFTCRHLKTL